MSLPQVVDIASNAFAVVDDVEGVRRQRLR